MEIAIDEALGVDDDYTCELSANNDPFEADSRCQSAMSELANLEAKPLGITNFINISNKPLNAFQVFDAAEENLDVARAQQEAASEAASRERAVTMKAVAEARMTQQLTRSRSRQSVRRRSVVRVLTFEPLWPLARESPPYPDV